MRLPRFALHLLQGYGLRLEMTRNPDRVIGTEADPYLFRWHVFDSRFVSIRYHVFVRSDDPRALHNHPWAWNASVLIAGHYREMTPADSRKPAGERVGRFRSPGDAVFRWGAGFHRVVLFGQPARRCRTLFIVGHRVREWGFACPKGFVPWRKYTAPGPSGESDTIGAGCGDDDPEAELMNARIVEARAERERADRRFVESITREAAERRDTIRRAKGLDT